MNRERARSIERVPHGSSDDPDVLDFSANINPRRPDGVESVYRDALETATSYPADPPLEYREAAARYVDCNPEEIIPTPGGLAAIRLAISLSVDPGDPVVVPAPSFGSYAREVRLQGGSPTFVAHDNILDTDPAEYALAIVCNPNNPTGTGYPRERLLAFVRRCREAGTEVLLDEAFLGFTDQQTLAGTPGVTVARSLTKLFGLPGIRAGFAVSRGEAMERARRPWNVSAPALAVGQYCMSQDGFIAETRRRIERERSRIVDCLPGAFDVFDSVAPFVLVDLGDRDVDRVLETFAEENIALRDARTFRRLDNHVRIAIRDRESNDRLLEVFDRV